MCRSNEILIGEIHFIKLQHTGWVLRSRAYHVCTHGPISKISQTTMFSTVRFPNICFFPSSFTMQLDGLTVSAYRPKALILYIHC